MHRNFRKYFIHPTKNTTIDIREKIVSDTIANLQRKNQVLGAF